MNIKLVIASTIGIGTVGGTVGIGYVLSQPKNLKQLLEKEGISLLDTESDTDDKQWTELAKKHKGDKLGRTKNDVEITVIEGLDIGGSDTAVEFSTLKTKCKELFSKPITNDKEFKKLKENTINWCTKKSPLLETTVASNSIQQQSQASLESASTRNAVGSGASEGRSGDAGPERVLGG